MPMPPILRDFPASFDTARLTIRSPQPGDGPEVNAAVRETLAELQPWMPWAAGDPPTVEESEARLREGHAKFLSREDMWLLLFLKGTNTLVGSSGLHVRDWTVPRFEIGYWARTRFAGQGYITEAVLGIADFGFNVVGAKRIEIHCDALNERSAAVARRAGFIYEGTLRHDSRHHLDDKRLRDTMIFALVRDDD
jgi:RimJ/RimL family protein N-acetyltransferase